MKRCYLQKKKLRNYCIKAFSGYQLYGIHELHCSITIYEINTLASIFKWLVAWKRGLQ